MTVEFSNNSVVLRGKIVNGLTKSKKLVEKDIRTKIEEGI